MNNEIDWTKVPMNTKVQVRDHASEPWLDGYLCSVGKHILVFYEGQDSTTAPGAAQWEFIKLHPDVKAKPEWLKEYHLRDGDICLFFDHDQDDGEISEYWDWSSCGHRSKGNVCWKRAELICKKENREDLK